MSNVVEPLNSRECTGLIIRQLESSYRTLCELEQLLGEVFLSEDVKRILSKVNPRFRVAVLGDVSSGKSTFLNCLLGEADGKGLLATSPVNETSVPVYIKYSPSIEIYVQHFTASILRMLDQEIERASMECESDRFQSHRIVMLKDAKARVCKDTHVVSGALGASVTQGVVEPIPLEQASTTSLRDTIADFSALSSGRDLSGIAKLVVGVNSGLLSEAKNIEFVDCVGSAEVDPLAEVKLQGVLNDNIDFIVYVLSDMAMKSSFTSLFDVEAATQIATCGRLLLVLNKLDSYNSQVRSKSTPEIVRLFLDNVARTCPFLKDKIETSGVFLLSCEALMEKLHGWQPREAASLHSLSMNELTRLRNSFSESQHYLERCAASVHSVAGDVLSLVQMFDLLKDEVLRKLSESTTLVSTFDTIVSELEAAVEKKSTEDDSRDAFTKLVAERCQQALETLEVSAYSENFRSSLGDPLASFREIRRWAVSEAKAIYNDSVVQLYQNLTELFDQHIADAYETFARRQDIIVQHSLNVDDGRIVTKPFSITIAARREMLLSAARDPMRLLNRAKTFERFATQFLFHHCTWVTNNTKSNAVLRTQLDKHVSACIKRYIDAFIVGSEPATLLSYGGPGDCFMETVNSRLRTIDSDLDAQFRIYQSAMRIYTSHRYFTDNRNKYQGLLQRLVENSVALRGAVEQLTTGL